MPHRVAASTSKARIGSEQRRCLLQVEAKGGGICISVKEGCGILTAGMEEENRPAVVAVEEDRPADETKPCRLRDAESPAMPT
jgi:hypothetical protein